MTLYVRILLLSIALGGAVLALYSRSGQCADYEYAPGCGTVGGLLVALCLVLVTVLLAHVVVAAIRFARSLNRGASRSGHS